VGGPFLYVADSLSKQIQRRKLDDTLSTVTIVSSPGPNPTALYYDGEYLWSADSQTGRIYQHADDDTLSVKNSFKVESDATGIYVDGDQFWTADSRNRLFCRHRLPPTLSVLAAYALRELDDSSRQLSAFTLHGGNFWVGQDGSNVLLERPWWRFRQVQP